MNRNRKFLNAELKFRHGEIKVGKKQLELSNLVDFLCARLHIHNFGARIVSSVFNKKVMKIGTLSDYFDLCRCFLQRFPMKYVGFSIAPAQIKQEFLSLITILSKRNILSMLEIGTSSGGTLFLFTRAANPDAKLISLDLPGGEFGSGYRAFRKSIYTNFARKNQRIFLIRADSHQASSLSKVKSIVKGQKLDFLFIDGDHTYEGVKQDFRMYGRLVRKGGLIAFHDICQCSPEIHCEVSRFWNEIKQFYMHEEIINNPIQGWAGIGVLYL